MKTVRKVHRYFALVLGLALLVWLVSGIVMLLPDPVPAALKPHKPPTLSLEAITLSPAEVLQRVKADRGPEVEVIAVALRLIQDRVIYQVDLRRMTPSLIDAETGEKVEITAELAESLVRARLKEGVGAAEIERLDDHSLTYPWGPLPVYRLAFAEGEGVIAYVTQSEGKITFTDWRKQLRHLIVSFHEFTPLRVLAGNLTRQSALMIAGVLCLVIVATGYYMEFFPRSRGGKKAKGEG